MPKEKSVEQVDAVELPTISVQFMSGSDATVRTIDAVFDVHHHLLTEEDGHQERYIDKTFVRVCPAMSVDVTKSIPTSIIESMLEALDDAAELYCGAC